MDRGFHLPLFPGTLAFNESCSCSSTANLFSDFGGREREGKGSVVLFKQQQKSSLINGPAVLARRSQVPFTWRLPGQSILFPILPVMSSVPPSPAESCAVALAWEENAPPQKPAGKLRGEKDGRGEPERLAVSGTASTTKWNLRASLMPA